MPTYYKVTDRNLQSCIINHEEGINHKLKVQYKINEFVKSNNGTPLFVFENLEAAKNFIYHNSFENGFRIFECKIKNKREPFFIPLFSLESTYEKIFKLFKNKKRYSHLIHKHFPKNTIFCSQVMLVKEIR